MQFISGNPSFRCGRPAKCPWSVHMGPIIDCSSSLETHHSAADVLQNAGCVSTLVPPYVVFLVWEPFMLLWTYHKMLASVSLMCFRPFLSGQVMELWPKVVKVSPWRCHPGWSNSGVSFTDVFHTTAFCSHGGSMSCRGVTIYAFRLTDVKFSESYA